RTWYNVLSETPNPPQPPLHPGTGQPIGPDDLAPLFPMDLILQEVSTDREIPIPQEVLDVLALWRPTPLYRAHRLEQALGTGSRIYHKYEGVSPAGSHKPNTAVPQAYYNAKAGRTRLATETGAGQWGSSLAFACQVFGLECKVYMVHLSYRQKQLALAGESGVDVVIGCVGGGSNFGGIALPFVGEKIAGADIEIIACEPAACPTLTRGPFAYDFGDTAQLTPLVAMHTLGHDFVPPGIHAGGLRYHGVAPIVSQLLLDDLIRAEAYTQTDCFGSAVKFARAEGIIPAPESSHAIHG